MDASSLVRMIGGRRRYNAERRRKADERRKQLWAWLEEKAMNEESTGDFLDRLDRADIFRVRGTVAGAARAFGVHPSTICRDLQRLARKTVRGDLATPEGAAVCAFERECQGGRVVRVFDPDGRRLKGAERRALLKRIPRYLSWRTRPPTRRAMPTA